MKLHRYRPLAWRKRKRAKKAYVYECERCARGENHAPYHYGPFPWLWCHETNAPHSPGDFCRFLYGCNICNASARAAVKWPEGSPELWETFVAQHIHSELDLVNIPRYMMLGMSKEEVEAVREKYLHGKN